MIREEGERNGEEKRRRAFPWRGGASSLGIIIIRVTASNFNLPLARRNEASEMRDDYFVNEAVVPRIKVFPSDK